MEEELKNLQRGTSNDTKTVKKPENENEVKETQNPERQNLQLRTRNLREKLNCGRGALEHTAKTVQQSVALQQQNDNNASKAMLALGATKPKLISKHAAAKPAAVHLVNGIAEKSNDDEIRTNFKKSYVTRGELMDQVNALQTLLTDLTLHDPQLKARAYQLVQSNPKLKDLELFSNADITRCHRDQAACSSRNIRTHLDSENSIASSVGSHQLHVLNSNSNFVLHDEASTTSKKSRKRNKKNRTKKENKSTQEQLLAKYINTIVAQYLCDQQELISELEFKDGFADLEKYAQRLVEAGLGRIVTDEIRINRKNNRQSFVTLSNDREGTERDCIILSPVARRFAFDGDIVRAFVMNTGVVSEKKERAVNYSISSVDDLDHSEDTDSLTDPNELDTTAVSIPDNCPKGFVILIEKQTSKRQIVGTISFQSYTMLNDEHCYYKLKPHDMRVPMVYIPVETCRSHITAENKNDICGFLFVAIIRETDERGHCIGELIQPVGRVGNLEAEIKAIMMHNGLSEVVPFEQRFNDMFAEPDPPIDKGALKQREDLRKKCVFTIDPLTARDLDDAMSVERVEDNQYEVGVHISDVSHYLHENTELDNIVKDRATSIYLVTEVIHMLPQSLCFKCSLLPGEDKLSFSVFWRMNLNGEILSQPRFTRSVINSSTQLAYEHAQKIIDNPKEKFDIDDFPTIHNGFTPSDIANRVRILNTLAQKMREQRFASGALSINNPKLRFNLDGQTGEPLNYEVDSRLEANFLIEEFMLLANQSTARFIYDRFPNASILRSHGPPLAKSMKALREKLANIGIQFDEKSSKSVHESIRRICSSASDPIAMDAFLNTMLTKPMARAKYFCSEGKTEEADLWHYALSIPIYTHFTSPIRRYPDILVHRLLAAALNYCPPPKRSTDELHAIAKVCNDQKFNARNAGDESINLFFKRYIKSQQSIMLRAVVTEIFQHLVNVVTIETGHTIAINYKMQKVIVVTSNVPAFIVITDPISATSLKLQLFSTIDIMLVVLEDRICGFFVLSKQNEQQLNRSIASRNKQQHIKANDETPSNVPTSKFSRTNDKRRQQTQQQQQQQQQQNHIKHTNKHSKLKISKERHRLYTIDMNRNESC